MTRSTRLLIIGAGPYGLAMAAYCKHLGLDYVLVGEPMSFWKNHMPRGMYLRSRCDWHLDPLDVYTLEHYLQTKGLTPSQAEPLSLPLYLDYAEWFQRQRLIESLHVLVERLDVKDGSSNRFEALLSDGLVIRADNVLVSTGYGACAHIPEELARILPEGRFWHSRDFVDFDSLKGQSCLIIGGRQSAFEAAALACEGGAAKVHVSHRHETPAFAPADWSWVNPLLEQSVGNPGWYKRLSEEEKQALIQRMWSIGRKQLEAWLWPRLDNKTVQLWPNSRAVAFREVPSGKVEVELDTGSRLSVDTIILATGYKTDVSRLPFMTRGNVMQRLDVKNGIPVLDDHFQSSLSGLYFTNRFASAHFGNFFDFTAGVRASARIIGAALSASLFKAPPSLSHSSTASH
ncbi:NAD(P)/FAD-dependent oxidoreductase [Archangium violaceum]|uniref:NAD(P)-binding domain-containing protein n=1 Tax=Archangium violaceum TaxID=83451 RepID=UPI002B31AC0A|nr:NAD(P)/FAD-dependent oxidoreductase [Archangium violaceum]